MKKGKLNWAGVLMVAIGLVGGILVSLALNTTNLITENDSMYTMMLKVMALFAAFFIATYIQVIIHEGGHLIAGLKSGYHLVSFRIGNMMWMPGRPVSASWALRNTLRNLKQHCIITAE